jgi:hypothetical protein
VNALVPLVLAAHDHFDFGRFSVLEWALFVAECAITVWVLWLAVKTTLRPGEDAPDHVKRSILSDDESPAVPQVPTTPRPAK